MKTPFQKVRTLFHARPKKVVETPPVPNQEHKEENPEYLTKYPVAHKTESRKTGSWVYYKDMKLRAWNNKIRRNRKNAKASRLMRKFNKQAA